LLCSGTRGLIVVFLWLLSSVAFLLLLHQLSHRTHPSPQPEEREAPNSTFLAALQNRASPEKDIFLMYADYGVISMALNFYAASIHRHGIQNYLFVSSSKRFCRELEAQRIGCFLLVANADSEEDSSFGTKAFKEKMNIRTFMVLHALRGGFHVLHSDCDVFFFSDPLPVVKDACGGSCDVAPLWDLQSYNAGFIYIRSTSAAVELYAHMQDTAMTTEYDDQKALNDAMMQMNSGLRVVKLPKGQFQCGQMFWEEGQRTFAGDNVCEHCVAVHNNWIVGTPAKEYRFKEMHMWLSDRGGYYSNTSAKYLSYAHTDASKSEVEALLDALAIGQALGRAVILPKFQCRGQVKQGVECSLAINFHVRSFDLAFKGAYREHTFLSHPLVPPSVLQSQSDLLLIQSASAPKKSAAQEVFVPRDNATGATSEEIEKWFGHRTEAVLRFHSLYDAFSRFTDNQTQKIFRGKSASGIATATPRQRKTKRPIH
jgi:hypothetical protein